MIARRIPATPPVSGTDQIDDPGESSPRHEERPAAAPVPPVADAMIHEAPRSVLERSDDPAPVRSERTVSPGSRFSVTLDGSGWIYLGSSGPIDFISREREAREVRFTFRMHDLEDPRPIELAFELQNLVDGRRSRHEEVVIPAGTIPERDVIPHATRGLVGRTDDAGAESGASLIDRVRSAASGKGPLTRDEEPLLEEVLATIEGTSGGPAIHPGETLAFLERLVAAGDADGAIPLLEALLVVGSSRYDYLLFSLATFYEQAGPHRDIDRSLLLYRRLRDEYPLSDYWERTTRRIEYLERHFFFIR
ncbi:MAG: hypothetical protein EA427_07135 [Spirochaetaceae bacterium]|nr:MAG: hypothetical protein EA427_07135 [Spirochaetaceae bacterium]